MTNSILLLLMSILLICIGGLFFRFGWRLLYKEGFVEKLRKGMWHDTSEILTEKESYFYDKYTRGIKFVLVGSITFLVGILWLVTFLKGWVMVS